MPWYLNLTVHSELGGAEEEADGKAVKRKEKKKIKIKKEKGAPSPL